MYFKNWSSEDILQGRYYADLLEDGEFGANTREPLEIFSPWQISVKGIRLFDGREEEIKLYIELDEPLSEEETETLSAGEIFSHGWQNYSIERR